MPNQGLKTAEFGKKLTQILNNSHTVYFDHGDRAINSNVYACKGSDGNEVKNINRLADIDFMIGDKDGNAAILGEIEERTSSPKKIIGDIFAIALCNQIAIKKQQQEYYTPIQG